LPSTSAAYLFFALVFAVGAGLFVVGARLAQSSKHALPTPPRWTRGISEHPDEPLDIYARLELIARLSLIGAPWCVDLLRDALDDEPDAIVRGAVRRALARLDASR